MRIAIAGGYGHSSAGDDAPLIVLTDALREGFPEEEFDFAVISRHDDPRLMQRCGTRHVPNLEYDTREASRGKWFRGLNYGDDRQALEAVEKEIAEADVLCIGAGSMLTDIAFGTFRGPIPLTGVYAMLAKLHRTPYILFGMSVGPFRTRRGPLVAGWLARDAAAVTCRDYDSTGTLQGLAGVAKIYTWPDPVLALKPASDAMAAVMLKDEMIPPKGARPRLALALRELGFKGLPRPNPLVVETLRELAAEWEFLFIPQCTYSDCDDRLEAALTAKRLPEDTVCPLVSGEWPPEVLMRAYDSCDAALTMRLHGAVFASMAGVPTFALNYLPKVAAFMHGIGAEGRCFELDKTTPKELATAIRDYAEVSGAAQRSACQAQAWTGAHHAGLVMRVARGVRP